MKELIDRHCKMNNYENISNYNDISDYNGIILCARNINDLWYVFINCFTKKFIDGRGMKH